MQIIRNWSWSKILASPAAWLLALVVIASVSTSTLVLARYAPGGDSNAQTSKDDLVRQVAQLKAQVERLQRQQVRPELGAQMIELQIRHDRLWWAGQAGNWNLAYYMVGELGETLHGIEQTNGDAAELQPQQLSVVMPSMMNPAIKGVQQALAKQDKAAFAKAYDRLSASCTACHQVAGNPFLIIQRPQTRLLDNLRYAPESSP